MVSNGIDARRRFHRAVWRWHFVAGLCVLPFLTVLALSGLVMALQDPIEAYLYGDLKFVDPPGRPASAAAQVDAVRQAYPNAVTRQFVPGHGHQASEVIVTPSGHGPGAGHGSHGDASTITVYVDPAGPRVLGALDPTTTLYHWAKTLHGTLFLGSWGDHVVETVAGVAILMVGSGLWLWWPRPGRVRFLPAPAGGHRAGWRDLHASTGFWIAGGLLAFLLSGLAWTDIWGGRLVQAWSAFPAERQAPQSDLAHATLNQPGNTQVPWVLEATPLPASGSAAGTPGAGPSPDLDSVLAFARGLDFERFRVALPNTPSAVWTISATTMAGDVSDPRRERTVHLDQYTGRLLADVGFADYPLLGKAMTAGVPFHQADLGAWNVTVNVAFCLTVLLLLGSGTVMWWKRRPSPPRRAGLPPTPPPGRPGDWRVVVGVMFLASLAFPLAALAIGTIIGLTALINWRQGLATGSGPGT